MNKDLDKLKNLISEALEIKEARKSLAKFAEYCFDLKLGKIHVEWHQLATQAMREKEPCIIFAPRGHGKCFWENEEITLANGQHKKVKDCKVEDEVLAFDEENFKIVKSKIIAILDNGIKPIYKVTLMSGQSNIVTSNHPFFTPEGWKSIDGGLKVGDFVAIVRELNVEVSNTNYTDDEIIVLAYMIADGYLPKYGSLTFTCGNKESLNEFKQALEREFGATLKYSGGYDYRIIYKNKKRNIREFFWKKDLLGKKAHEKELPDDIFSIPLRQKILLLRTLWKCDGTINHNYRGEVNISYSTSSLKLAKQIQELLLHLNIRSSIYKHKIPKKDNFTVQVIGESKKIFLEKILSKEEEKSLQKNKERHSNIDVIPRDLVLKYLPITLHYLRKYFGIRLDNSHYQVSFKKLEKLCQLFPQLQKLLNLSWSRIKSIEYLGKAKTIGLEVEKYHTHISNGIISHNSTIMAVLRPLFLLGRNRNLRIKIVSHSDKKASDILRQIKEAIERNPRFKRVFPWIKKGDIWSSTKINIERDIWSKDVSIEALGVLSGATGGRCVGEGTLIITSDGIKPIEEVKEGEKVLTKEGKFRRVIKTWKRFYKGKVIVIETAFQNFNKIVITPEHKILAKLKSDEEFKVGWFPIKEISNKKFYLVFPRFKFVGTHKVSSNKEFQKQVETFFAKLDFWRLCGYYLAEGCLSNYREDGLELEKVGKGNKYRIAFFFGKHEKEYIEDVFSVCKNLGLTYSCYEREDAFVIYISDKTLWKLFTTFGHKAPNKKIPYWVLGATYIKQLEFIKGYLRGDGCITKGIPTISTTSVNIAVFLAILLTRFGCFLRIEKQNRQTASFSDKTYQVKPLYNLFFFYPPYKKVFEYLREEISFSKFQDCSWYYDEDFVYIPVKKIYEKDYEGYVYDLSVKEDNSFCSIWTVLHNSDYIIFDDIVEFNNTIKEPARIPMVKEAFYNNWLNLLEPNSYQWCLIGTIWTKADLHWELMNSSQYKYKKVYRIDLETLEPIWEEYWSKERLLQKKNEIPYSAFARAFGNVPITREEQLFEETHFERCITFTSPEKYKDKCDLIVIGVDLAVVQKKESANTALFVLGYLSAKDKYVVLQVEYGKMTSPETVRAIQRLSEIWQPHYIIVESNQYQLALLQWLEEMNLSLPVESFYTTAQKYNPEVGLPSIAMELEKQKWIIPVGKRVHSEDCTCGICQWIRECIMYPYGDTTDVLMASYFAREGIRKHISKVKDDYYVTVLK